MLLSLGTLWKNNSHLLQLKKSRAGMICEWKILFANPWSMRKYAGGFILKYAVHGKMTRHGTSMTLSSVFTHELQGSCTHIKAAHGDNMLWWHKWICIRIHVRKRGSVSHTPPSTRIAPLSQALGAGNSVLRPAGPAPCRDHVVLECYHRVGTQECAWTPARSIRSSVACPTHPGSGQAAVESEHVLLLAICSRQIHSCHVTVGTDCIHSHR